ncbi:MAG TPA: hypothetical protein VF175_05490 [Lacipirellula sp.]
MRPTLVLALAAASILALPRPTSGLTILEDNSNVVTVSDLTGFATHGNDMAGLLQVTAVFLNGTSESITWAATGPDSGGIAFVSWDLGEGGDTFLGVGFDSEGLWKTGVDSGTFVDKLILTGATSRTPEGQTEGVVFDRTGRHGSFGTANSYRGRDFEIAYTATVQGFAPGFDDFIVTYSNPIDVVADGPGVVGDLFGQVTIDPILRSGERGYFYALNELGFRVDTDTVGLFDPKSNDGRFETLPVPEPGTSAGLAAVSLIILLGRSSLRAPLSGSE